MIDLLLRFGFYNLLPGMMIGVLVWLAIYAATNVMKIEYVPLRLPLLYVSLLKSSLVILGISSFVFAPVAVFPLLLARPLPVKQVLPFFMTWVVLVWLVQFILARHARKQIMRRTLHADQAAPFLTLSMNRVLGAYRQFGCTRVSRGWVCCEADGNLPIPKLLVAKNLRSPLITLSGGDPVIVFPLELATHLSDAELEGALAHELAHLALRSPAWCSSSILGWSIGVNPISWLLAAYIRREEEMACDDMAVTVLGQPEIYVEMLMKSYRYAVKRPDPMAAGLNWASQLLGLQPAFSIRTKRLLQARPPVENLGKQRLAACLLWAGVLALLSV